MIKKAFPLVLLVLAALPCRAAVAPIGEELAVKDGRPNNEHSPAVGFAADGHGLIVWTDSREGLRGRLVNPDGALAAEDLLLVPNDRLARLPGEGTEIYRKDPALLMFEDGGFWLFWTEEVQHVLVDFFDERHDILDRDVRGQRFDAAGQPLGGSMRINAALAGFQSRPQVQALACDAPCARRRFVLAWEGDDRAPLSGAGEGILAQLLDEDGAALSPQVRLSQPSQAQNVALAPGPEGGLVAAWEAPDGTKPRLLLRARFFDAALQPLGKPFVLSPKTAGSQRRVSLVWNETTNQATAVFDRTIPTNGRYRVMAQDIAAPAQVLGEPLSVSGGFSEAPSASVLTPAKTVLALWVSWKGPYPFLLQGTEIEGKAIRPGSGFQVGKWPRFDLVVGAAPNGRLLVVWEGWAYGIRQGIVARWLEQTP